MKASRILFNRVRTKLLITRGYLNRNDLGMHTRTAASTTLIALVSILVIAMAIAGVAVATMRPHSGAPTTLPSSSAQASTTSGASQTSSLTTTSESEITSTTSTVRTCTDIPAISYMYCGGHPTDIRDWDAGSRTRCAVHRRELELHRHDQLQFGPSRTIDSPLGQPHQYRSQRDIQRVRQTLHQPRSLRSKRDGGLGVGSAGVDVAELEHYERRDDLAGRQHPDIAACRRAIVLRHGGTHLGSVPDTQQPDVHLPVFRNSSSSGTSTVSDQCYSGALPTNSSASATQSTFSRTVLNVTQGVRFLELDAFGELHGGFLHVQSRWISEFADWNVSTWSPRCSSTSRTAKVRRKGWT